MSARARDTVREVGWREVGWREVGWREVGWREIGSRVWCRSRVVMVRVYSKYLAEWQASRARLDALADPANQQALETLYRLGGQLQLASVQQAHAELGRVLGITTVRPVQASAQVGLALDQALEALKAYVCKVVAWPDPDEPGSQELADALLEPLVRWEDYQPATSGTATVPVEAPTSLPA